jgi:gas vesicle protein
MSDNDRGDSGLGFLSGLVLGGFVGAILAIVLTPQSGEETRDYLRGKAHEAKGKALDLAYDLKDRAASVADDLREQADDLVKKGRDLADSTRSQVSDAIESGRKAARNKIDELKND